MLDNMLIIIVYVLGRAVFGEIKLCVLYATVPAAMQAWRRHLKSDNVKSGQAD